MLAGIQLQLGRKQLSELGFSLLQEGVFPLLPLLRQVEEPRSVARELHHARLPVFVGIKGRLDAR